MNAVIGRSLDSTTSITADRSWARARNARRRPKISAHTLQRQMLAHARRLLRAVAASRISGHAVRKSRGLTPEANLATRSSNT